MDTPGHGGGSARGLVGRTAPSWIGTAWFGPWWLVYRGPVGVTDVHHHHALQAVLGGTVEVLMGGAARSAPLVVPPNAPHRIAVGDDDATLVYIDGDIARMRPAADHRRWSSGLRPSTWVDASALAETVCPPGRDSSAELPMVRAARLALADPDNRWSIEELSSALGISSSRLSHLFTDGVGTTMRSYRRWQRLLLAAEAIAGGAGLSEAAHAAGFADGPHLARTFRRHFGLSVIELTRGVRFATT